MQNVFDFDQYDQASKELLIEIFEKHGIPIGLESDFSMNVGDIVELGEPVLSESWSRVPKAQMQEAKVNASAMAIRVSRRHRKSECCQSVNENFFLFS